jgi:DNA-binding beta-propeller fold protein YncE
VEYFSPTGAYLGYWGSAGSGNQNFAEPLGVAVNSAGTTVYVADYSSDQVKYFTAQ